MSERRLVQPTMTEVAQQLKDEQTVDLSVACGIVRLAGDARNGDKVRVYQDGEPLDTTVHWVAPHTDTSPTTA